MSMGRALRKGLALGALLASPAAADAPQVVASIKPVHSLVAGVMQGVAEPALVVQGAGSPHTYSLRPSEARAIARADLVFWVGEGMEIFLAKPLEALPGDGKVVELAEAEGVTLLPTREGGMFETEAHEEHHEENDGEHAHGASDMHLWLDPHNAEAMVAAIAVALGEVDPEHATLYRQNAAALRADLRGLDAELQAKLAPVRERPFVVFHDAYQYFEDRYDLNPVGAISIGPERRPGAQRIREIQDRLRDTEAVCVFAEPQFEPAVVETVIEGTGARKGVLDPLGATLEAGPGHYAQLLENLAAALVDCLGAAQSG
jgi:zinc transport system substrate-binding protein